jgi:hypothetical protein
MKQEAEQLLEAVLALEAALQEGAEPHVIAQLRAPSPAAAAVSPALACCRRMRLEAGNSKFYELVIARVPVAPGGSAPAYAYGTCWGPIGKLLRSWPQGAEPTLVDTYEAAKHMLETAAFKKIRTRAYAVVADEQDIAMPLHVSHGLRKRGMYYMG